MGKEHKFSKAIWIFIGFGAFAVVLVIWATPFFYDIHPNTDQESTSNVTLPESNPTPALFSDTLILKKDTLISHTKINVSDRTNQYAQKSEEKPTIGDLGTFGDSAGFFNAIFSALAFVAVVYTLRIQITKDNKDEERNLLNQFRDHCFTLMTMLSEIVAQLKITINNNQNLSFPYSSSNPGGLYGNNDPQGESSSATQPNTPPKFEVTGRACFKFIYEEYPNGQNVKQWIANNVGPFDTAEMTEDNYQSLRKVMGDTFDHYFRTLYRILLFIKESDMSGVEPDKQEKMREHCADMLRAQLSTYEMALLYYNALFPDFRNTSKALFEKFCIFDNLDPNILCLKSESDYYILCKIEGQNGRNFNEEIHYDFKAFKKVKAPTPALDKVNFWKKFFRQYSKLCSNKIESFFRKLDRSDIQSDQSSEDSQVPLNPEEQKILNFLKSKRERPVSYVCIAKECNISKGLVEKYIKNLKSKNRITSRKATKGNIYKVL